MNISKAMKTKLSLLFISLCIPFLALAQKDNKALLANQFLKSGNFTKASQLYNNLYNTHKSTNYYQGLLNCYLALNNIHEAEKLVKKHSKKYSKNSSVLVDYAHILILKGEERKAQKKFDQVFDQLEINEQFVGITANKLTKYQYLEMAIKAYEIGLRNPSKGSFRFQMARIYGQLGDIEMMYENYLTLIITNKAYLQSVKTTLGRTVNNDPENENNQLLKALLLKNVQQYNDENINDLLIWLFIQEKNFEAAFDQEKALDQRLGLDQKKVFELASICRKNKAFNTALNCYNYIVELGTISTYYLDAQLAIHQVQKEVLETSSETQPQEWLDLEADFIQGLNKLGKTSYTILLLRDLAQIQAFQIHNIDKASISIQEALSITTASSEDLAECKLVYADILLLQNEIWDAIIYYSQVDKAFKHDLLGHEAKFRRAKISYYQGDFDWAQAQLDVLKKSTSKLIANNAMELSLLIQDNLNLDTTTVTMEIFSRADLLIYQNKLNEAYNTLDSIVIDYQGHSLVDEALYKQHQIKIAQGKIEDASELLDQIINFFSYDILADDAKFAQAQLQESYFKNTERATELYQDIMTNHQDSFYLSESRKRYRVLRQE
jgi:adenosyl cobinamide kinase/adenosyl cobinamide phosphate guanylyltransferase